MAVQTHPRFECFIPPLTKEAAIKIGAVKSERATVQEILAKAIKLEALRSLPVGLVVYFKSGKSKKGIIIRRIEDGQTRLLCAYLKNSELGQVGGIYLTPDQLRALNEHRDEIKVVEGVENMGADRLGPILIQINDFWSQYDEGEAPLEEPLSRPVNPAIVNTRNAVSDFWTGNHAAMTTTNAA